METFYEKYFDGKVDFNGDCLEIMEYRHDWANFRFTLSLYKFFLLEMMPELILHSRSQGKQHAPTLHLVALIDFFLFFNQMKNKCATIMTVAMISTVGFLALV